MAQGRRDFLFGIDQGTRAFARLKGPKVLYVGLHGHAPSTFPAADTRLPHDEGAAPGSTATCASTGCDGDQASVYVAPENVPRPGRTTRARLPPVSPTFVSFPGVTTFAQSGKVVRTSAPLRKAIEIFGAPTVQTSIAASGGWSRLVAVLTARTPAGQGDRRQRGRRPDEERRAEGHDRARQPGDVRPEGLAAHADARLVVDRAVGVEPPLPRSPDGAERSRARRHGGPEAAGPAHAGHEVTARAAAVALAALALVATAGATPAADPGVTSTGVLLGGTVPLTGEAAAFGTVGPGAKAYFDYVNARGRRQRPQDRVPLLRRRLQPRADRAAHAPARRAGPGLRDLQLGRHREQPRDPRLPERTEGAAALRRRRLAVDRARASPATRGRWGSSRATEARVTCTARRS